MSYRLLSTLSLSITVLVGTVLGKAEGLGDNWHGHVTAVTVAPEFRRLGLAQKLMEYLGDVSEELYVVTI